MKADQFKIIFDEQISRVEKVLIAKKGEYATEDDVLSNFKQSANLRKVGIPQAVTGMMAKHTVSVYNMAESGKPFTVAQWDEKITDHINYLILLKATLVENINPQE